MTDWRYIIAEIKAIHLQRYGRKLSNYKLGDSVGVDHSQIDWLETHPESEPRDTPAQKLRAMLAEYQLWEQSHSQAQRPMQSA